MLVRTRSIVPAALVAATLAIAGCGGGDDGASGPDLASLAPADTLLFAEVAVRPEGELQQNIEALARDVAGIDDVGARIASELEESAEEEGEQFDFREDVEPWLGERGAIFQSGYDGESFTSSVFAVHVTDEDAARSFIEQLSKTSDDPVTDESYEGVDYKLDTEDDAIGVMDGFLVLGESEEAFKRTVDASKGDSLIDSDSFTEATAGVSDTTFAELYYDLGSQLQQSDNPQFALFLREAGVDLDEATLTATLVPAADNVEVDMKVHGGKDPEPGGDPSEALAALPADSFFALAETEIGESLSALVDQLDEKGIPGELPPGQLKQAMRQIGIDPDEVLGGIEDAGLFVSGSSKASLGGALVLTMSDPEQARNTVSNLGLLLRASETPGVSAISGEATGFSVRDPDLGRSPAVVVAAGDRLAIGYGLAPTLRAVRGQGATLGESPNFQAAEEALGGTPISGFLDGPATLRLIDSLTPRRDPEYREARPYLAKAAYVAFGGENGDEGADLKLIVGFGR